MNKNEILDFFSAKNEEEAKRNAYKYTDCSAFIEFEEDGVVIGSIVEGSDHGTTTFHLKYDDGTTKENFQKIIDQIEQEADLIWKWANEEDENGVTDAQRGMDFPLL